MALLLKAVKCGCLEAVKKIVSIRGIPANSRWLDYTSINYAIINEYEEIAIFLLENDCRVNKTRANVAPHDTPLHSAVKLNSVKLVTKLLEKEASIIILNRQGYSPLHLALILKHEAIIDVILNYIVQKGKYANVKSNNGLTHFHVACTRKNVEALEGFIKFKVNVKEAIDRNSDYRPGYTAKHFAAEFQSLEAVRILANATDRNCCLVKDKNRKTALQLARKSLEELSIMVYILSGESKERSVGYTTKMSQFHMACTQRNPQLVKKFIENGAAVNNFILEDASFCPGYSALHCAVEGNCMENVRLLLKEHADVEHQNAIFATPLHLAMYNDDPERKDTIVDLLYDALSAEKKMLNITDIYGLHYFHVAITRNKLDLVKEFLHRGEDIEQKVLYNHRQFTYYSPLHFAVRYKHFEMTKFLIERGADVQSISKDGPPLQIAIETGATDIIDLLLENNPKVNEARKIDNKTMIHSLIETYIKNCENINDANKDVSETLKKRLLKYIERFVNLGCDVNDADDNGNTALHIVCDKLFHVIPCIRLLLNLGADINIENSEADTPFNCAFNDMERPNSESYMVLYHHVQKLKVIGFWVNIRNERCCQRILDETIQCQPNANCFRMTQLDYMKERRRNELMEMKAVKLTTTMSLYNFVRLDKNDAATYVTNDRLKDIVKREKDLYPIYGYLIRLQFARGTKHLESLANESPSTKRKRSE